MKNNILIKSYFIFIIVCTIVFIVLFILGNKDRIGYLNVNFDLDRTVKLNDHLPKEVLYSEDLDYIKQYILSNSNISNYAYNFRINYYTKNFRNSDLYGVYIDIDNLYKHNNFLKNIGMLESDGTPYGNLISSIILDDVKIEASYKLKIKRIFFYILMLLYIVPIIYFLYSKINIDKFILKLYNLLSCGKHADKNIDFDSLSSLLPNIFISFIASFIIIFILVLLKVNSLKIYSIFLFSIVIFFYLFNFFKIKIADNFFNIFFYYNSGKNVTFLLILIFILFFSTFLFLGINIIILIINLVFSFILIIFLRRFSNNYFSIFLAIIVASLSIYKKYALAINDVYHHTSHFTSAFFINNGIPYQENMYSILGHYAILMEPFFKIFGFNVETYSILLDIFFAISIISIIIVIFLLIKNPFYINIALLLLLYCYFTLDNERPRFIVFRMFFPSIMILYITILNSKKNILLLIVGYLLSSLAILFNPESGLICLFSLVITNIYTYCYDYTLKDKKFYINIFIFILMSLFSLLLALIILNLYNVHILGGDKQSIELLLFPLLSGQVSFINSFYLNNMDSIYILLVLVLIFTFLVYLYKMNIFKKKQHLKLHIHYPILIFISILGLGLYSYNMNRYGAGHNVIVFPMLVILIPFILNKLDNSLDILNNSLENDIICIKNIFIYLFILTILLSGYISFSNFSNLYSNNFNKFYTYLIDKNYEENGITKKVTDYMSKYAYNGIVSFGGPFIYGYANLGWTNSLILPNESDWWNPNFGYTKAVNLFLEKDPDIFLSTKVLDNMSVYYINSNDNNSVLFFNNYVNKNYTNVKTEYEEYGLYMYKKISNR